MLTNHQKSHYARMRRNATPAIRALELARANDKPCYTSELIWSFRGNYWNKLSKDGYAWIENLQNAGLRFIAYADEIPYSGVEHSGWFIDEFQDEKMRGVVVQRQGKNGKPIFIYGYECPYNPETYFLAVAPDNWETGDFQDYETNPKENAGAKKAAFYADRMAESDAEESREYSEAYQDGCRLRQAFEDLPKQRANVFDKIRIALDYCRLADSPKSKQNALSLTQSALQAFESVKRERKSLFEELQNTRDSYDSRLLGSFNDGFAT